MLIDDRYIDVVFDWSIIYVGDDWVVDVFACNESFNLYSLSTVNELFLDQNRIVRIIVRNLVRSNFVTNDVIHECFLLISIRCINICCWSIMRLIDNEVDRWCWVVDDIINILLIDDRYIQNDDNRLMMMLFVMIQLVDDDWYIVDRWSIYIDVVFDWWCSLMMNESMMMCSWCSMMMILLMMFDDRWSIDDDSADDVRWSLIDWWWSMCWWDEPSNYIHHRSKIDGSYVIYVKRWIVIWWCKCIENVSNMDQILLVNKKGRYRVNFHPLTNDAIHEWFWSISIMIWSIRCDR